MKQLIFGVFFVLSFAPIIFHAQTHVPTPVADQEMRDTSSIRRRSMELERVKQDSGKPSFGESSKESEIKFGLVKADFEKIQLLQDSIVTAYTKGKSIDFQKLSDSASEMRKRSVRLAMNLFSENSRNVEAKKTPATQKRTNMRDLIVELDNAIGRFVASPIFQNTKLVDTNVSETSQMDLAIIIRLSETISKQASMLDKAER